MITRHPRHASDALEPSRGPLGALSVQVERAVAELVRAFEATPLRLARRIAPPFHAVRAELDALLVEAERLEGRVSERIGRARVTSESFQMLSAQHILSDLGELRDARVDQVERAVRALVRATTLQLVGRTLDEVDAAIGCFDAHIESLGRRVTRRLSQRAGMS